MRQSLPAMIAAAALGIAFATAFVGCERAEESDRTTAPVPPTTPAPTTTPAPITTPAPTPAPAPTPPATAKQYTCAHHPEVVQNAPGNCPKCNMALTPK